MDFKDIFIPIDDFSSFDAWKFGAHLQTELKPNQWVFLTCSDGEGYARNEDFASVRELLYGMSSVDLQVGVYDLGDLISGKTHEDTQYIVQEVLSALFEMNCRVVFLGGGSDLEYSFFSAVHTHRRNVRYVHFDAQLDFDSDEVHHSGACLSHIFENESFSIREYVHAGYQRHWANPSSIAFLETVGFEAVKLSDIVYEPSRVEPMLRFADIVTLNSNVIESLDQPMNVFPQVNGLNRREICACMQNIGLGKKLLALGLFHFQMNGSWQNIQLLAQMLWYFWEGVAIQQSRPPKSHVETYIVMVENEGYTFQRETFSNEWYFGSHKELSDCIPCSYEEFHQAKKGRISPRLLKKYGT